MGQVVWKLSPVGARLRLVDRDCFADLTHEAVMPAAAGSRPARLVAQATLKELPSPVRQRPLPFEGAEGVEFKAVQLAAVADARAQWVSGPYAVPHPAVAAVDAILRQAVDRRLRNRLEADAARLG